MLSSASGRLCVRSSLAASLFGTLAGCNNGFDKKDPRKTSFLLEDNSLDSKTSPSAIPSFLQQTPDESADDDASSDSDAISTTSGIDGQHITYIWEISLK